MLYRRMLWLLCLAAAPLGAQAVVIDRAEPILFEDARGGRYLLDREGRQFGDLSDADFSEEVTEVDYGSIRETLWVRYELRSALPGERDFMLELIDPEVDELDVFIQKEPGIEPQRYSLGHLQEETRPQLFSPNPAIPLRLSEGETLRLTIRCRSFYIVRTPLRILPRSQYLLQANRKTLFLGLIFGSFLLMLIQMLSLFFFTKALRYLYLGGYILSVSLFIFVGYGPLRLLLLTGQSQGGLIFLQRGAVQAMGFLFLTLLLYHADLYKRMGLEPGLLWIPRGLILLLAPLTAALYLTGSYRQIRGWFSAYLITAVAAVIALNIRYWKRLDTLSRNFIFSFAPPTLFVFYRVGEALNWIPYYSNSSLVLPLLIVGQVAVFSSRNRLELRKQMSARDRAEHELQRQKDELEQMFHQMKTPLSNIRYLTRKGKDEAAVAAECGKITGYIDARAILFDPMGTQSVTLNRTALSPLIDDAAARSAISLLRRSIRLETELPGEELYGLTHGELLKQALEELLANAAKYGPRGSAVSVRLASEERYAVISIEDQGTPIPPGEEEAVFKKGVRLAASNRTGALGEGLGLYRVSELMKKMQGSAFCEALPGGNRFCLRIPLSGEEAGRARLPRGEDAPVLTPPPRGETPRGTLMIVEDEELMLRSTAEIFREDFRMILCRNGEEALRELKARRPLPDLILCDIMMPRVDGFTLMERMKAELPREGRSIPVVLRSSLNSREHRLAGFNRGSVGFVDKSCGPEELKAAVLAKLAQIEETKSAAESRTFSRIYRRLAQELPEAPPLPAPPPPRKKLTGKQRMIVDHVRRGCKKKEVEAAAGLSRGALKDHLKEIYEAYGLGAAPGRKYNKLQALLMDSP